MTDQSALAFGGPAYVAVGDPTVASGAGMINLAQVPRAEVKPNFFRQGQHNELGQPLADGQYGAVQSAAVTLTMFKKSAALLAALIQEFADESTSMSMNEELALLELPTLAIMPVQGYGTGPDYLGLIWVPAFRADDISAFIHKVEATQTSTEPITITGMACKRLADQADQAINAGYRIAFLGDAADALPGTPTSPWLLPTGY